MNGKIDKSEIDCPVDMPGIIAKLDKVDVIGCNGVSTHVVSETANKLGAAGTASYRAITTRDCADRRQFGLTFSSFGFTGDNGDGTKISSADHPGEVEVMAFDAVDGVFNYYKELEGKMTFFGSSLDFVTAGPGGPGLTNTRGCANCHTSGGIKMKELEPPWTHWAQADDIPGADTLVNSRAAYMGSLSSGANMQEAVTEPGNIKWNESKAKILSTLTTADLKASKNKLKDDSMTAGEKAGNTRRGLKTATQLMLEPLFCTVQVNINNSASLVFSTNRNGLFGPFLNFAQDLDAALAAIGSNVPTVGGAELSTPFMALEPSHEDANYLSALSDLGVLDERLIQDLMVDFTRPVMSDDRCGRLSLVPDLDPKDRTAAKIRDAIIGALKAESPGGGSPAAQLLSNLEANAAGMPPQHSGHLSVYQMACGARDVKAVLRDALKLRSLGKQVAFLGDRKVDSAGGAGVHPFLVFEFSETMPVDNVKISASASPDAVDQISQDARFNPNDCTLVTKFIPPGPMPSP